MSDIQRITLISDPTNEFPKMPTTVSRYDCLKVSPYRAIDGMPRCGHGQSNRVITIDPYTQVAKFSVT